MGHGGGQVVSLLDLYSNDPSSNPAENCKIQCLKNENKQKEAGICTFLKATPAYHMDRYKLSSSTKDIHASTDVKV